MELNFYKWFLEIVLILQVLILYSLPVYMVKYIRKVEEYVIGYFVFSSQNFPMKDTYVFLISVLMKIAFKIGFWLISTGEGMPLKLLIAMRVPSRASHPLSFMFKQMLHFYFNKYFVCWDLCKAAEHKCLLPCYISIQSN